MTNAVFLIKNGDYIGFKISGHSGAAEYGSDIVCSAISAMTMLVVNTISDVYKQKAEINTDNKLTTVSLRLFNEDKLSSGLIKGFYNELVSLSKEYPKNLRVYKML